MKRSGKSSPSSAICLICPRRNGTLCSRPDGPSASSVKSEDAARGGLVTNGVRFLPGGERGENFQRGEITYRHRIVGSVAETGRVLVLYRWMGFIFWHSGRRGKEEVIALGR